MNDTLFAFWNPDEKRLRAGLRLLIFLLLRLIVLQAVIIAVGAPLLAATGNEPSTVLTPDTSSIDVRLISAITVLVSAFISVWLSSRFVDRRSLADLGLSLDRSWFRQWLFGLILGSVVMCSLFVFQLGLGWVEIAGVLSGNWSSPLIYLAPLLFIAFAALAEDLVYWGYLLKNLSEGLNLPGISRTAAVLMAVLCIAAYFSLGHTINPGATVMSTLNVAMAGFMLALGYLLTGQLAITIGLHFSWNLFQGYVLGFPVSGLDPTGPTVLSIKQTGDPLWTGGGFGPEGGILGACSILLVCVIVVAIAWTKHRLAISASLAAYTRSGSHPEARQTSHD